MGEAGTFNFRAWKFQKVKQNLFSSCDEINASFVGFSYLMLTCSYYWKMSYLRIRKPFSLLYEGFFALYLFIHLKNRNKEKEREIPYLSIAAMEPKPGVWNSVQVSHSG